MNIIKIYIQDMDKQIAYLKNASGQLAKLIEELEKEGEE